MSYRERMQVVRGSNYQDDVVVIQVRLSRRSSPGEGGYVVKVGVIVHPSPDPVLAPRMGLSPGTVISQPTAGSPPALRSPRHTGEEQRRRVNGVIPSAADCKRDLCGVARQCKLH